MGSCSVWLIYFCSSGDAGSWLKNKLSKNSLDSLWGSLEGKFNKFVSGEDIPAEEAPVRKSTEIMANPYDATVDGPPARSASAFDFRNANRVGVESLRRAATPTASMVSEAYLRRSSSPGAHAATGPFGRGFTPLGETQAESQQQQQQQQHPARYGSPSAVPDMYSYGAQPTNATMSPFGHAQQQQPSSYYGADESTYQPYQYEQPAQDASASSYYGQDTYQPHDAQEQQQQPSAYGNNEYGGAPAPSYEPYAAQTAHAPAAAEEDDDLGFGNSSLTKPKTAPATSEGTVPDRSQSSPPEAQSESVSGASDKESESKEEKKGWGLFSIFSRSSTPSNQKDEKKAVKANLGEESSFYYDKEAGRWVNKTVSPDEDDRNIDDLLFQ